MKYWHLMKLALASIKLIKDPNRLEEVFAIFDRLRETNRSMNQEVADDARLASPVAAAALRDMPRLGKIDPAELVKLPVGTLGRAYADFLIARKLDPSALPLKDAHDEPSYVEAHLYETHDVWHVVTGFETDVAGELGLQAFYATQMPGKLPTALLAVGFLNTLIYAFADRHRRMDAIVQGYRQGQKAKRLFGVRWAEMWNTPLMEVRRELGIEPVSAPVEARPVALLAA